MDKQSAIYPHNELLFSNIKKWNTDTCEHWQSLKTLC